MKKIISIIIVLLMAIGIVSCKNDTTGLDNMINENTNKPDPNVPTPSAYYLSFKAGGVLVTATELTVTRGATTNPRTLVITATAKNGAAPKFKFYLTEPAVVGFSPGLSVGNSERSYPESYVEYTNSANVLYSSRYTTTAMG